MSLNNTVTSLYDTIRTLIKDTLNVSGRSVFEYNSGNSFTLCEDNVDESSIVVSLNGTELTSGQWSYDSAKNKLSLIGVGSSGDTILVTYSYYNKFSDTEIYNAISASFVYFVCNRYKKTFCISSANEIIALDNTNPTTRELMFICIIASILLDPQNINIRTNEFTVSANRNLSDTEQISKAFTKYQRFVGSVDKLNNDCKRY